MELRCELAGLLHRAGEMDEAIELYRAAVAADPALRRGWYNLGCLANEQGREADAVDYFRRSIELDPAHAPSWHNLGQALFNLGETDGAIERYRQAIALGAGAFSESMLAMTIGVSPTADPQTVLQTAPPLGGAKSSAAHREIAAEDVEQIAAGKAPIPCRLCLGLLRIPELDEAGLGAREPS